MPISDILVLPAVTCKLWKQPERPTRDERALFDASGYILTRSKLFFYHQKKCELNQIQLTSKQFKAVNAALSNHASHESLSSEQLKTIKAITNHKAPSVYVVGDIHGELGVFKKILKQLNRDDTLVLVGDLTDRGEDSAQNSTSAQLLDRVLEHQQNSENQTAIYAVKGNHEMDFLAALQIIKHEPTSEKAVKTLMRVIRNGGNWMFTHPEEGKCRETTYWLRCYFAVEETHGLYEESKEKTKKYIQTMLDSSSRMGYLHPNILTYEAYLQSLPFVIKIEDERNSAWVVHADLPLSDEALQGYMEHNNSFTPAEITHMTDARASLYDRNNERRRSNLITYCGHSIIDEETPAIREHSKHVNLDYGMYDTFEALLVNHTLGRVKVVTTGNKVSRKAEHTAARIQSYLDTIGLQQAEERQKRIAGQGLGIFDRTLKDTIVADMSRLEVDETKQEQNPKADTSNAPEESNLKSASL